MRSGTVQGIGRISCMYDMSRELDNIGNGRDQYHELSVQCGLRDDEWGVCCLCGWRRWMHSVWIRIVCERDTNWVHQLSCEQYD